MKLTKTKVPDFIRLVLLAILAGTLSWALFERLLHVCGSPFSFSTPPIGLRLNEAGLYLKLNPGSIAGALAGKILFDRL